MSAVMWAGPGSESRNHAPDKRVFAESHRYKVMRSDTHTPVAFFSNVSCAMNTAYFLGLPKSGVLTLEHWVDTAWGESVRDIKAEDTEIREESSVYFL